MSTLPEVRQAFRDALADPVIVGLNSYKSIPSNPIYPCVIPIPKEADYTKAFQRGIVVWEYDLIVLVSGLDSEGSQDRLDQLIDISGGGSIPNALYNNRTLGLGDVDVAVTGVGGYLIRFLNIHVGATLKVRVVTRGTG